MNVFQPFITQILMDAGFSSIQINKDLIEETTEIFIDRFLTVITSKLSSEDDKVIFLELLEKNNESLISAIEFAKMKLKDYEDTLENIMDSFATEYIKEFKQETLS